MGRRGLTLVELLVVVAVVAVLVGLLLPAVHKVREAMVRTRCGNRLRQVGSAAHGHHDTVGRLPLAWMFESDVRPWLDDKRRQALECPGARERASYVVNPDRDGPCGRRLGQIASGRGTHAVALAYDPAAGLHGAGGRSLLFCDGHVEWRPCGEVPRDWLLAF